MSRSRLLTWVPIILLGTLAGITFWLDQAVNPGGALGLRNPSTPDIIVEEFSAARFNVDGSLRYALVARRMEHRPDDDSTQLFKPTLTHTEAGKAPVKVSSELAYVSKDGKEVEFTGDVRIVRSADDKSGPVNITTSHLKVKPDENTATSDKEVVITDDHGVLKGVGLEFNNLTRKLRLNSRVRGEFKNPKIIPNRQ